MIPLVIDTDPGVDDAMALMLAAASAEVDLRAVTTVFGNTTLPRTTANAGRVLALAGRPDVPVAAGAARPLVHAQRERAEHWHGDDGLGGRSSALPRGADPDPRGALGLLASVLQASSDLVTLAAIGPLTNVALLLAVHPELARRIGRIVWMGGSLSGGNATGAAEFNAHCDPEAAHRVLTQPDVPVTMVPLDLTRRCPVGPGWLAALAAAGPATAELGRMVAHYRAAISAHHGVDAVAVHDAVAMLEAILPGTLRCTPQAVWVACDLGPARGATVAGGPAGPTVGVALDANTDAVSAEILRRLTAQASPFSTA